MACRQKGFTLLEILVSFVLFVLVGTTLFQLIQAGSRNIAASEEITHASLIAKSLLSKLEVTNAYTIGNYSGTYSTKYNWTIRLTELDQSISSLHRHKPILATITISWPKDKKYEVKTLVLSHGDPHGI